MDPSEFRVLAPNGLLGYGYPSESLAAGLRENPHVIGLDGGSTDPGPYYLGSGTSFTGRQSVKRDLRLVLLGAHEVGAPVIVGSCGGAGGEPHLAWVYEIVREIVAEERLHPRVALIHAEQDPTTIRRALSAGRIRPLAGVPPLDQRSVDESVRIVAQMGFEPIQAALEGGADVVLAGRSCDVSVFAALPILRGADVGLSIHASKIIECGAYCADPGSVADSIIAVIHPDDFVLKALSPNRRVTALSAGAHSLYEQSHPSMIVEPVGTVDVSQAQLHELPDGSLRVSGSHFLPAETPTLKLEGVRQVGFRSVSIAGITDPRAVSQLEFCLQAARQRVDDVLGGENGPRRYQIHTHVFGDTTVATAADSLSPARVGLVLEVVADDQQLASDVCSLVRSTLLHHDYPGRIAVGGNLALLFSPHDVAWGPAFEFSIYHLWQVDDLLSPFPIEFVEL